MRARATATSRPLSARAWPTKLRPIRENFAHLMEDRAYLEEEMRKGAERATYIANKTLTKVKKRVGLLLEK